ncbi:SDR family oxidoreductase [Saccharopolyspora spinosporotrichia]
MTNSTILVLGGTGKTGRRVAAKLAARGADVRVASRRGAVRFDWDDRSTWAPALEGADAAYVIAPSETDDGETISEFIVAATAAGVGRLVLLSAREVETSMVPGLKAAEAAVRRSDARWTILRPSWFAQNFSEDMFLPLIDAGLVALPTGDGKEPFIDAEDIADVAVAALTEDGHDRQVYELSGPDLLSFPEAVEMIAAASGREVAFKAVTAGSSWSRCWATGFLKTSRGCSPTCSTRSGEGERAPVRRCAAGAGTAAAALRRLRPGGVGRVAAGVEGGRGKGADFGLGWGRRAVGLGGWVREGLRRRAEDAAGPRPGREDAAWRPRGGGGRAEVLCECPGRAGMRHGGWRQNPARLGGPGGDQGWWAATGVRWPGGDQGWWAGTRPREPGCDSAVQAQEVARALGGVPQRVRPGIRGLAEIPRSRRVGIRTGSLAVTLHGNGPATRP